MKRLDQRETMAGAGPLGFKDRLLAEAVRFAEEIAPLATPEVQRAEEVAAGVEADLEQRIVARARALPLAGALRASLRQDLRAIGLVVLAAGLIAALAGAATVRAALGPPRPGPINFYLVLGGILGVQSVLLLLWMAVAAWHPRGPKASPLGALVFAIGQGLARRLHRGRDHTAAVMAIGSVVTGGRMGRWALSAISHALWLSFNIGCLVALILLLSARHYTFGWETTILSEKTYVPLTRVISALPDALGFLTPSGQQIAQSQWIGKGPSPDEAREAWSGLLFGCVVVYGIAPRALLLGLCLLLVRADGRRFRLDTHLSQYARLRPLLMPEAIPIGRVDAATETAGPGTPSAVVPSVVPVAVAKGRPVLVGLEIEPPQSSWPPEAEGIKWHDLGFVEGREDRHRVLEGLRTLSGEPRIVVVVCSLTTTPDRGIRAFLGDLAAGSGGSVRLVLSGGERLRRRAGPAGVDGRVDDWRRLAGEAGVDRVAEVDLDHLTDTSGAKLAALVRDGSRAGQPERRLDQACALIVKHVEQWQGPPTPSQQAELHQAIAGLYRHEQTAWQALLGVPARAMGDLAAGLRPAAERAIGLLPDRLRRSRRWLLAGAAAGTLGGVAAAMLVAPATIALLPLWSAVGAVIAGLVEDTVAERQTAASSATLMGYGDAVRTAALYSLLLELQGRQEAEITRLLDRVVDPDEETALDSTEAVRLWLDGLRHRYALAVAEDAPR